jgi:hypothetical protein
MSIIERLSIGTTVDHRIHGRGVVMQGWGAWNACRNCYARVEGTHCPGCKTDDLLQVSGLGIYDVRFFGDGKTHSVNRCHLRIVTAGERA